MKCMPACIAGLRRKGAVVADHELERIMAQVDLDGNHTLDFQVRSSSGGGGSSNGSSSSARMQAPLCSFGQRCLLTSESALYSQ
mgnify:CR=1 FL=1